MEPPPGSSDLQIKVHYDAIATAALSRYDIAARSVTFLGHNSGIAYRLEGFSGDHYLLKIHEPVGDGERLDPAWILSGLEWLTALSRVDGLVVQTPVVDRDGAPLASFTIDGRWSPCYCTLQRWVPGEHLADDVGAHEAHQIGMMIARLHLHGDRWEAWRDLPAMVHDESALTTRLDALTPLVNQGILTSDQWHTAEAAADRVYEAMGRLGRKPRVWGPIHGDLHQESLVFHEGQVYPIDFACLQVGHYALDLGVALYHLMHLDGAVRRALVSGYQAVHRLVSEPLVIEAFVCAAAIDNLAFQVSVPGQLSAPLFRRNVRQLADGFCHKLAANERFALV